MNPVSQKAIRLVQEGKFEEARTQLLEEAHSNPGSSETFVLLGVTEIQLHDYSAARQALEKALHLNADSTDALYNLGILSLEESRPKQAVTYFETAERKGRSGPELAVNLVRAQFEAGDRQEGLKTARDASRHFQDVPAFQLALGKVFLESKIAGEAVTSLKRANLLAPNHQEILLPLADACLQSNDVACAGDALARARATSENDPEFHYLSGKSAFLRQEKYEGFRELEEAVKRDPKNPEYLITLARYYQKYGEQEKAISEFKAAGQLSSTMPEIPYGLAVSYFIEDDFNQAIELSTKALELDPKFDRALFLLAISRFAKSQYQQAEELLNLALSIEPKNAFYRCFLGMVQFSNDRTEEALVNFRTATQLQPTYALAHFQLGRALTRMGNYAEARLELERAVTLQPDLGEAYYRLGLVYRQLGETQKAAAALAEFKRFKIEERSARADVLRQAQDAIQGKP